MQIRDNEEEYYKYAGLSERRAQSEAKKHRKMQLYTTDIYGK